MLIKMTKSVNIFKENLYVNTFYWCLYGLFCHYEPYFKFAGLHRALVADDDKATSKKIAVRGLVIAFMIVAAFIFAGPMIFRLFGISIDAFRIAGGILVAVLGYNMINGDRSPDSKGVTRAPKDPLAVAVSPLAMPLFAGPGTLTTAISLAHGGLQQQLITLTAFALLCILTYLLLRSVKQISHLLGDNLMLVITKLMGLILFTIGVGMVIVSVQHIFIK